MKDSKKGFTIIEVVVVLAIAGLIFGVVFWALPNLQKSNRDSTRRTVAANILANLDQYAANTNGIYPPEGAAFTGFLTDFFSEGVDDPLEGTFAYIYGASDQDVTDNVVGTLLYGVDVKCDTANPGVFLTNAGGRAIAVAVKLEQGAGYCVDNS